MRPVGAAAMLVRDGVAIRNEQTDADGNYSFAGLAAGEYIVQFITPDGFTETVANVGDDAADSDSVGGLSGCYTLVSGDTNDTVDAGLVEIEKAVTTSVAMHEAAIRMVRPGMMEADVAAEVERIAVAAGSAAAGGVHGGGVWFCDVEPIQRSGAGGGGAGGGG